MFHSIYRFSHHFTFAKYNSFATYQESVLFIASTIIKEYLWPLLYGISNHLVFFLFYCFSLLDLSVSFTIFKSLSTPHIWFAGENSLMLCKYEQETWLVSSVTLSICDTWSKTLALPVWMSNLPLQNMELERLFKRLLLNLKLKFYKDLRLTIIVH